MKQQTTKPTRPTSHTISPDTFAMLQSRQSTKLPGNPKLQMLHRSTIDLARRLRRAKRRLLLEYVEQNDSNNCNLKPSSSFSSLSDDDASTDINRTEDDARDETCRIAPQGTREASTGHQPDLNANEMIRYVQ